MEKLRAFWKYDLFPYVLSGEIVRMDYDGDIEAKEYGRGNIFHPIKIYPNETGIEIQSALEFLTNEYNEKCQQLLTEYKTKIIDVAPFMKEVLK